MISIIENCFSHHPVAHINTTIEENLIVKEGNNKIKLLKIIYNCIKSSVFHYKRQSELKSLYGTKIIHLDCIHKLIISDDYGDDFDPKAHEELLKAVFLELEKKSESNRIFGTKLGKDHFRTYIVASFNEKLLRQNNVIQHISSQSLFSYVKQSKLHEQLKLRDQICNRINAIIGINQESQIFEENQASKISTLNTDFHAIINENDSWTDYEADWPQVFDAIGEDLFTEDFLKIHPRPINSPLAKKARF